jgi:hypothetical protein
MGGHSDSTFFDVKEHINWFLVWGCSQLTLGNLKSPMVWTSLDPGGIRRNTKSSQLGVNS